MSYWAVSAILKMSCQKKAVGVGVFTVGSGQPDLRRTEELKDSVPVTIRIRFEARASGGGKPPLHFLLVRLCGGEKTERWVEIPKRFVRRGLRYSGDFHIDWHMQ